ncbi:cutinase-domain-containing protein [Pestalotiopsis sp. NC0098]|nr:cutinase-domain-containing protein [Pestalotiopsis sp. NC0098]
MKSTQTLSTFLFAGLSAASPMFGSGTGTDDLGSLIPTGSGSDSLGGLSSLIPTGSGSDSLGGLGSLIPTGSGSDSLGGLGSLVPTGTGSDSLGGLGSLIPTGSSSDSLGGLGGLGALSSLIPSAATETGSADSSSSSLTAKAASGCTAYTLLFARGTTETGTLGTVVGPGLQKSVQSALGADQVTVKGTTYAADMAGITAESTGSGPGSKAMTADATSILSSCPDTKLILTGYSQGGMVVHNAAKQINTAGKSSSVLGAVTFGDPFIGQLPSNIDKAHFRSFCASGDSVCGAGAYGCAASSCTSASAMGHLGYGSDVNTAATFIKSIATA